MNSKESPQRYFFRASAADFKKIPGSPIAYWANDNVFSAFERSKPNSSLTSLHRGISTGNTEHFARLWYEVPRNHLCLKSSNCEAARFSGARWFPYNRGGVFRKWYGLGIDILDYEEGGCRMLQAEERCDSPGFRHDGSAEYFLPTITWTALTAGKPSFRVLEEGYILGHKGSSIKTTDNNRLSLLGLFNSNAIDRFLEYLSPTLDINISQISALPLPERSDFLQSAALASALVNISKRDWDAYEISWDFTGLPLLHPGCYQSVGRVSDSVTRQPEAADVGLRDKAANPTYPLSLSIKETYTQLRDHWREMTLEMQRLEQENNRIFIDAYGLQNELTPEVSLKEITLTCTPYYRYGKEPRINTNGHEKENQPIRVNSCPLVVQHSFEPDADNVIPMLDGDWFTDDITDRFCKFLKVTFGDDHYDENLTFIEKALGKDIRKYFLKDFYNDHLKRYKKRPIYWQFSSLKGSFNALIYMHRYRQNTVSVVLNDHLREFRTKLSARKNHLEAVSISTDASQGEKTKALKEIENLRKMIDELDTYEREILYPLATEQVEIDLDDGVKVNYQKFGEALKKIPGLAAKNEE